MSIAPIKNLSFLGTPANYSLIDQSLKNVKDGGNHMWIIISFVVAIICVGIILYLSYNKITWNKNSTNSLVSPSSIPNVTSYNNTPTVSPIVSPNTAPSTDSSEDPSSGVSKHGGIVSPNRPH